MKRVQLGHSFAWERRAGSEMALVTPCAQLSCPVCTALPYDH